VVMIIGWFIELVSIFLCSKLWDDLIIFDYVSDITIASVW